MHLAADDLQVTMLDAVGACAIRPARRDEAALLSDLAVRSKATRGYGEAFMRAWGASYPCCVSTCGVCHDAG